MMPEPVDHSALARQIAADSMVLLKNDAHTLPIKPPSALPLSVKILTISL